MNTETVFAFTLASKRSIDGPRFVQKCIPLFIWSYKEASAVWFSQILSIFQSYCPF